ncbi:gastrula zinc finger protein XlCGF8.2DB-like [Procambarus clarkii]|uniref:gastrula zinc finger protein XlCGF8.2DB-like n=1 Tax=Procambarus clarkii TaxID=6728 RepID=UPI003744A998
MAIFSVCTELESELAPVTQMEVHIEERSHVCSICPKQFSQKFNQSKHVSDHAGEAPDDLKGFRHRCDLLRHMRINTKEKQYQSFESVNGFSHEKDLAAHLIINTEKKQYQCLDGMI